MQLMGSRSVSAAATAIPLTQLRHIMGVISQTANASTSQSVAIMIFCFDSLQTLQPAICLRTITTPPWPALTPLM
jgi:hypothetical protein